VTRIQFVGEGVTDIGGERHTGVVPRLTEKVLTQRLERPVAFEAERVPLPRFHRSRGYETKVACAIREANRQGFDGIAIVVDRDGDTERIKRLKKGVEDASSEVPLPAVVGVAVETIEAWLLADEQAIREALDCDVAAGIDPEKLTGRPGTMDHPKDRLAELLARDTDEGRTNSERFDTIADRANVAVVERRCKQGFAPYAKDVRHIFGPLFEADAD